MTRTASKGLHTGPGVHCDALSRLEPLEPRVLLAGDVAAAVVGGNLILTGDAAANQIIIDQAGLAADQFRIRSGADATTVNGQDEVIVSGVTGNVRADLGDGDDVLQIIDAVLPGDLLVRGGPGGDTVELSGTTVAGRLVARMGRGDDRVQIENVTVAGRACLRTGPGHDLVEVESRNDPGVGTTFERKVGIHLGPGWDILSVSPYEPGDRFENYGVFHGHHPVAFSVPEDVVDWTFLHRGLRLEGGAGRDTMYVGAHAADALGHVRGMERTEQTGMKVYSDRVTGTISDVGEYYYDSKGERRPLLRMAGEFALRIAEGGEETFAQAIDAMGNHLAGHEVAYILSDGYAGLRLVVDGVIEMDLARDQAILEAAAALPGVQWAEPVYQGDLQWGVWNRYPYVSRRGTPTVPTMGPYYRIVVGNQAVVGLAEGVAIEDVLDSRVTGYQPSPYREGEYIVDLAVSGTDAVAWMIECARRDGVVKATPNLEHGPNVRFPWPQSQDAADEWHRQTFDAGDYTSWFDWDSKLPVQRPYLRSTNEVVVEMTPSADGERAYGELVAPDGPLAGWWRERKMHPGWMTFRCTQADWPQTEAKLVELANHPDVLWATPVFESPGGWWMIFLFTKERPFDPTARDAPIVYDNAIGEIRLW